MTGVIHRIHYDRGFAFIVANEGNFFVHFTACLTPFHELQPGSKVTFTVAPRVEGEKSPRAENVRTA